MPAPRPHGYTKGVLLSLALLFLPGLLQAAATLSVDRNPVRENESFTLSIQIDGQNDAEPDLTALRSLVDVLGTSQESRTTVVNRQVQSLTSWHISAMARQSGTLSIPPIKLGKQSTEGLEITVKPADSGPRSEREIYLEVEALPLSPYVQQQVIYTVRLVSAVVTADERMTEPSLPGGEAVVEQLGDRKIYTVQRGNRTLRVIESSYAIFPQKSGSLDLAGVQALVRVFDTSSGQWSLLSRRPSEFRLNGDPVTLNVRPLPKAYPTAAWLPASNVSLLDSVTEGALREGEPLTRVIRLTATGLSSGQLPEIPMSESPKMKAYPDRPVLSDQVNENGLVGIREQRIAYIPTSSGELVLPEVRIPWWNTEEDRLEYAVLPERVLQVLPAAQVQQSANTPEQVSAQAEPGPVAGDTSSLTWKIIALLAALGWLLTSMAWLRSRNKTRLSTTSPSPEPAASNRAITRALQSACEANNPDQARKALADYLQHRFPSLTVVQALRELENIAPGIEAEILALDRNLYGPDSGSPEASWQGKALWEFIKESMDSATPLSVDEGLVPLYPGPRGPGQAD